MQFGGEREPIVWAKGLFIKAAIVAIESNPTKFSGSWPVTLNATQSELG